MREGTNQDDKRLTSGVEPLALLPTPKDRRPLVVAFVIWVIINTLQLPRLFFVDDHIKWMIAVRAGSLALLLVLCSLLEAEYFETVREKRSQALFVALAVFTVAATFQLLCWPGMWSWDDISNLACCKSYAQSSWQHWLSTYYMACCLQLTPFAGGFILVQAMLAALTVGWCAPRIALTVAMLAGGGEAFNAERRSRAAQYLIAVPALLPPMLSYLLSGFRMGIYPFVELFVVASLLYSHAAGLRVDARGLILLSILAAIVASWRTEAVYYVVLFPLLLLASRQYRLRQIAAAGVCCILLVFAIAKVNNHVARVSGDTKNYTVTAMTIGLPTAVQASDESDRAEINSLNRVFFVSSLRACGELDGTGLFWQGTLVRDSYTDAEFRDAEIAYLRLCLRHPGEVGGAMLEEFLRSCGVLYENGASLQVMPIGYSREIVSENSRSGGLWQTVETPLKQPINVELRDNVVCIIGCIHKDGTAVMPAQVILWNMLVPIIANLLLVIVCLRMRRHFEALALMGVLTRVPLLFLTEPSPYAMYYLPVYLISYMLLIAAICQCLLAKRW